ncbi:jg26806 [Pararge aegeria aegeria]|uniref:Jg26806 protein n=1 Tax=Pararge aegeria aegeria TaxID=348720 RepID=A0A8S4SA87_9NEOP|nr:jg26806 [Pararge aegeria aegeria]
MKQNSMLKIVSDKFYKRIAYFGRNSSVQGFKYVFQENGTVVSKFIWLLLLLVFTGCIYLLLVPVIQRAGSVSFTPDTRYLNWNTKFPGVTVCEEYTPKIVVKEMLEKYSDFLNPFNLDYRRHIADRLYGRGSCSLACLPCGTLVPCNVTWRSMIDNVRKHMISVHSSEELSTNDLDKKFRFDVNTYVDKVVDYLFSIIEVDNELVLENEHVSTRRCRYNYEIPDLPFHTYQVYSYGACRLAQSTNKSFNYCGCVHPVRDLRYKDYYCNYTGINCLIRYEVQKTKLGKADNPDAEDCLPSCIESELSTVHLSKRRQPQAQYDGAKVNIRMVSLPTLRYQKSLLRTNLDFVVTVGGMVGLFFSASILSFVEIFYLIFRSPIK